jgi:cystathionine beta-lyase/cystathionine gamma-synthase
LLFASGMCAITTTLATLLSSGDHLVMVRDCYHRTREFALAFLSRWGIETSLVPAALYSLDREERREAGLRDTPVRYALGIEDAEDLIADLSQALATIRSA